MSVPRWFIDKHLRHLHGAAFRVYLVLCGQQARVGRNRYFRYTLPEIVQATGLKERAISMELKDLVKRQLIERHEHGRAGNRYRVVWGQPAATNGEPTPATTDKPVSGDTDVRQLNPPEPEVAGVVAPETRLADHGGQVPLRDFDSSEPPATTPAGELGDQAAGGSSATLAAEIHRLASSIIGRTADPTMIQDLHKAADNDPELLRTVLEGIDKRAAGRPGTRDNELERWRAALAGNKKPPYDAAFRAMFCEEVYRRCQNLRSVLKRPAGQPPQQFRKAPSRRERRRMAALADNRKHPNASPPTPKTLAPGDAPNPLR